MADILGVRVTPQLDTLSSITISNDPVWQADPAITYNGENYMVVWLEIMTGQVHVARVTPEGTVLGAGQYVCEGVEPDIAADPERSFVVCAREYEGVVGRFIDAGGQPADTLLMLAELEATATRPRVVYSTDRYLVVWPDFCPAGTDLDVFGRFVSADGVLLGDRITIADGPANQAYPDVTFDGQQYLVVWNEEHDIIGQIMTAEGAPCGGPFTVSHHDSLLYYYPAVCAGPDNYLVVWSRWDENLDVYGNLDVPTGIAASDSAVWRTPTAATIVTGPLPVDTKSPFILYDVSGRRVHPGRAGPGIYYLMADGEIVRKIIRLQ